MIIELLPPGGGVQKEKTITCILSQKGKVFFFSCQSKNSLIILSLLSQSGNFLLLLFKDVEFIKYGWYNILKRILVRF